MVAKAGQTVVKGNPEKLYSVFWPHSKAPGVHVNEHVVESLGIALDPDAYFACTLCSWLRGAHLLEKLGKHRALRC